MDFLLRFLIIATLSSLCRMKLTKLDPLSEVTAALKRYRDAVKNPVYSNDWAVEVYGGEEQANGIAGTYGFVNMGKVCVQNFHVTLRLLPRVLGMPVATDHHIKFYNTRYCT